MFVALACFHEWYNKVVGLQSLAALRLGSIGGSCCFVSRGKGIVRKCFRISTFANVSITPKRVLLIAFLTVYVAIVLQAGAGSCPCVIQLSIGEL